MKLKRPLWTYITQLILLAILVLMYIYGNEITKLAFQGLFALAFLTVLVFLIFFLFNWLFMKVKKGTNKNDLLNFFRGKPS